MTLSREKALKTLGLDNTATADDIKRRYRKLAMKYHPDRGDKETIATFISIKAAYELLKTPAKCPLCLGTGFIKERRGAFVDKKYCPRCWNVRSGV